MSGVETVRAAVEPLLSVTAARTILGVSSPTLYRLMERGEIPWVQVGGRRLIEPEALREFIAARRSA